MPRLSFRNGRIVYGLPGNQAFKSRHAKEKPSGQSLEEFSVREDFAARFAKEKLTRRYLCKPGDTIVEVGAYLGYHSMKVAELIGPEGRLYAIEMVPEVFEVLKRNLEGNFASRCAAILSAIGPKNGSQEAFLGGAQANGLRREVIARGKRQVNTTTVQVRRLDTLLAENQIRSVDLLSLQLNGTELETLKSLPLGFYDNVGAFAIAANYDRTKQPISHEIADILGSHGYDIEIFDNWVYGARPLGEPSSVRTSSPIFVGGCGRSGTTLLRVMLDSHPNICCGPESNLLIDFKATSIVGLAEKFAVDEGCVRRCAAQSTYRPQFIDAFLGSVARRQGKARWAEKTPRNVRELKYLFDNFPNARFIHVLRDGRDVTCSLRTHPKFKAFGGEIVPTGVRHDYVDCVDRWVKDVSMGLEWRSDQRVLEVKYEDLVSAPRAEMQRILDFVGEPWDESVLAHTTQNGVLRDTTKYPNNQKANESIKKDSIGRWRADLSGDEQELFMERAGDLLVELGYERRK